MFKLSKFLFLFLFLCTTQKSISEEQGFSDQSTFSPLAEKSLLLQSDRYDSLIVVVGERGHILYSINNKDWTQALVETRLTLTNVFMLDEKTGWAVGHDAVILKTTDGAKTWKKIFSDIDEEAPLLDLFFKDALNGIAIGAYSLIYVTKDGGLSWQREELNLSDNNETNQDDDSSEYTDVYDLHLNDITYAGDKRFYIAAEAGHILRSDDGGISWIDLLSPYQGSFFGTLSLSFDEVLAYGLRGHLSRSSDAGSSWEQIETNCKEMLTDAIRLSNGDIVVIGLAGTLLLSQDNGESFSNINLHHRHGLSSILEKEEGSILLTGDAGIEILSKDKFISGE